jgi:hypothetical protein
MPRRTAYFLALATWFAFLITAMILGTAREALFTGRLGEYPAHVVGTLLFIVMVLLIMGNFVHRVGHLMRPHDLWLIGLMWMMMTVCFEFLFFHFVAGVPLETLLAEYNLLAGRLWLLVLLTLLCGPRLLSRYLHK